MKRPNDFVGQTLASSSNIAAGFVSNFQAIATLMINKVFDADHFTHVHYDMLALEESVKIS